MPRQCLNWKSAGFVLAALLLLTTVGYTWRVDPPLVETDPSVETDLPIAEADRPKHLPENIVAAWQGAGAHVQVGWMQMGSAWGLTFSEGEKAGKPGDLPALVLRHPTDLGWRP